MNGFITIANKLNRKDSLTGLDVWYKTKISNCAYDIKTIHNVNGNVVSIGQNFIILVPFTGRFLPYNEWKSSNYLDTAYTVSPGDYVFLNVDIEENITPENIKILKSEYEPNVCEVKSVKVVENKNGTMYEIRIEGV